MYKKEVEIYADTSNYAVMRHPGRNFPGSLIQGDSLYILCQRADGICNAIKNKEYDQAYEELNELRNMLWDRLSHYKNVLNEHEIDLPFSEIPPSSRTK